MADPKSTETLTIRREVFGTRGDCWVARDAAGVWRTYAKSHHAATAAEAVAAMLHADEIVSVDDHGDTATVTIHTY